MTHTFRDALAMHRLNTMRQRSASAQAQRKAAQAAAACQCAVCQARRSGGNPIAALFGALGDADPADIAAPVAGGKARH